jgi:uncharacterized membrane protein YgcG
MSATTTQVLRAYRTWSSPEALTSDLRRLIQLPGRLERQLLGTRHHGRLRDGGVGMGQYRGLPLRRRVPRLLRPQCRSSPLKPSDSADAASDAVTLPLKPDQQKERELGIQPVQSSPSSSTSSSEFGAPSGGGSGGGGGARGGGEGFGIE